MQSPQLTEERLKSWLDTNQVQRERMCIALLSLNSKYTSIKPRRPKGGPDGGRDIEAVYDNELDVWGAVGLRNSATDSPADKNWVKKKFSSDLDAALSERPDLKAFVFFTNIDITPAEEEQLMLIARAKGITFVEIFYRERLRVILDSIEGLAARYMYLGISLSEAEQAAFFERFGSQLEQLITAQFDSVDKKLARLEFLHECTRPLTKVVALVQLRKNYTLDSLKHFRVLFRLDNYYRNKLLVIGGCYLNDDHGQLIGRKNFVIATNPNECFEDRDVFSLVEHNQLVFGAYFPYNKGLFGNMGELDQSSVEVSVTEPLAEEIESISLVANDYSLLLVTSNEFDLSYGGVTNMPEWPYPPSAVDLGVPWSKIFHNSEEKQELLKLGAQAWSPFRLDFTHYTPQKLSKEEQDNIATAMAYG